MDIVETLILKTKEVVDKLKIFSDENNKLKLEVDYLKKENELFKKQILEYINLKKNIDEVILIIERIIKKIDMM
ncbi:MAG: hypothetical protein LBL03_01180 [Endomicrobium sp.]|jgi:hypothetical protein|nr:hypothetical protein [Endomicrobium sp.]